MPEALYFISGASAPADIRGLTRFSVPLGISLSSTSKVALHVLCEHARMPLLRIFVDSGAFGEVDRLGAVTDPITDAMWIERVRVMRSAARSRGRATPARWRLGWPSDRCTFTGSCWPKMRAAWYRPRYIEEQRAGRKTNRAAWDAALMRTHFVASCFCPERATCHRGVFAELLVKAGEKTGRRVVDGGEVP